MVATQDKKYILTPKGDSGQTGLSGGRRVPKTNAQIELIGTVEELITSIGSARSFARPDDHELRSSLLQIQDQLICILQFFQKERKDRKNMDDSAVTILEQGIERCADQFEKDPYYYPTHCRCAALLAGARSVCRRAERVYAKADVSVGSKESSLHKRYLNRLGDYLLCMAVKADEEQAAKESEKLRAQAEPLQAAVSPLDLVPVKTTLLREVGKMNPMSLSNIKVFMQALEDEAARKGLQLVFAVCDRAGRPIAVHVMDDAFLASYDIAVNKAFTAVSLKMSTKELAALCVPGGPLYGLQQTNQGKIVIFGGGVTLRDREGNILGGLGVSGSTAEIDTMMGDVGEELFLRLQSR